MTKTESASLTELGMDEAELQARTAAVSAKINGAAHEKRLTEILESMPPIEQRTRRTRSDAGKPRSKPAVLGVIVKIPGAAFDLGYPEARGMLQSAIATMAPTGFDSETIWEIIEQLLREIDRLRK